MEEGPPLIELPRPYLGYSSIAHECANYLWHSFRWTYKKKIDIRIQRLFNRGHREEPIIVADLERAGMKCSNVVRHGMTEEEEDKAQITITGFMGHIKGHPDGDVINVPESPSKTHNLEMKTANDKKFREFFRFGVQRSNPVYYGQSIAYMHHKKQDRTLFIVTNKNDDSRYFERLHADEKHFTYLEERGADIICSDKPMPKLSEAPEYYGCRYCDARDVCHLGAKVERNCRTCINSRVRDNGEWGCVKFPESPIPVKFQETGCENEYRPFL